MRVRSKIHLVIGDETVVDLGEKGDVQTIGRHSNAGHYMVKFRRGIFHMLAQDIEQVMEICIDHIPGSDSVAGNHTFAVVDLDPITGIPVRVDQSYPTVDGLVCDDTYQDVIEKVEGRWEWL